jgi:hypothetical protein
MAALRLVNAASAASTEKESLALLYEVEEVWIDLKILNKAFRKVIPTRNILLLSTIYCEVFSVYSIERVLYLIQVVDFQI